MPPQARLEIPVAICLHGVFACSEGTKIAIRRVGECRGQFENVLVGRGSLESQPESVTNVRAELLPLTRLGR